MARLTRPFPGRIVGLRTDGERGGETGATLDDVCAVRRCRRAVVAALGAGIMAVALLATAAVGQQPGGDAERACPVPAPPAAFSDRDDIMEAHVGNVDCAAHFAIVTGFTDGTYRPRLAVRRDQMASFIVRTLEAAAVDLPPADEGEDFADVPIDNPHRDSIRRLEAASIVVGGPLGRPADQYGPELPVRRDQMASMLDRTATIAFLGFPADASRSASAHPVGPFPDVSADSVHAVHIQQAADDGLVRGFPDGTFRPGLHTRRDHMATFMTRLMHVVTVPVHVELTEVPTLPAAAGETVTVTATVSTQFDVPVSPDVCATPGEEVRFFNSRRCTVTFEVQGATPTQEVVVEPDEAGQAELSFTAEDPGSVTVTASIIGPGASLHRDTGGDSDSAVVLVAPSP